MNRRRLLERAPLDLRVNVARGSREEVLARIPDGVPTPISPWGIRLPAEAKSTIIPSSPPALSRCRTREAS